SSDMTRPSKPILSRSSPSMIGWENAAIASGSSRGYSADEIITAVVPAAMPLANGSSDASVLVVWSSRASREVSVLDRTRPSPGKCLSVVWRPAACAAVTTVATSAATGPGAEPYCRLNAPIGGLALPRPAGTTSATGARSIVTPTFFTRPAHSLVRLVSAAESSPPWVRADGIGGKSSPCSVWTWPPSWSAPICSETPLLTLAADCSLARSPRRSAADPWNRLVRNTPPSRYRLTVDCALAGSVTGVPTISSWPTWPSRPSAATVAETQSPPGPTETVTGGRLDAGAPSEEDEDGEGRNT